MPPTESIQALRAHRIDVRVQPEEKQRYQAKAHAAGYAGLSTFVRDVLDGVNIQHRADQELWRQLLLDQHYIGHNLNQLVAACHRMNQYPTPEDETTLELIVLAIEEIRDEMAALKFAFHA